MIEKFYNLNPYELNREEKKVLLMQELKELTAYHREKCSEYDRFLRAINYNENDIKCIENIPFFPVRMFKDFELKSIDKKEIFKTMTSSGTTGQSVSKIFVDKETAMIQQKVMLKILSDFWGPKRLPMLVIDTPAVLKDRKTFTARGAAVLGLQIASRDTVYCLNDDMSLNKDVLNVLWRNMQDKDLSYLVLHS